ncbi:MAG: acyl-CoA dehydrogenase family protein [Deltaproteobacteria bacterium]|nr:acyl-CoA dehydrogenase family protein [Deltaproteobacteria bacterium]
MFQLAKEQKMIREMAADFAKIYLLNDYQKYEESGDFPFSLARQLGQQGFLGLNVKPENGGAGAGFLAGLFAIEEIAKVYPSLAFFMEVAQVSIHLLGQHGTDEQRARYLKPIIAGEKFACIAATEPTGGSDLANIGTIATPQEGGYSIAGRKVYITSGGIADVCLVLAKTGEKASILLVEKGTPGFIVARREKQMGFKSSDVSELVFDNCYVSDANIVGGKGNGLPLAMGAFTLTRPSIGAIGLGIAAGAFAIALKYAQERVLYGSPISKLQNIQFLLAEMETEIEKARWVIYQPAAMLDAGANAKEIAKYSARAKAVGAEVGFDVTKKAIQILGGYGVSPEYRLAGLLNDAMELFPATGTVEIMKVIQAGEIIRGK